jgi:inorganic triphosphatase YgiF
VQEVEIKLAVAPEHASRVASIPALRAAAGRPRSQRLHSTYFDTPDLSLARAGITLRVRRQGRRRIQAVKLAGSSAGGLHRRTEVEAAVSGEWPELAVIADATLRAEMARAIADRALVPLFATDFGRRTWTLEDAGSLLEVALDRGEIVAGDRREPICEVEIEVKAGPSAAAFALAREIAGRIDAQPLDRSKFERALALAVPDAPGFERGPPHLAADDPLPQAFAHIAAGCVRGLHAAHRGLAAGYDVESVHQMRVALRRLSVARRLFPGLPMPQPLDEERQWLHAVLGEARNWDVFFETLLEPVLRAFPGDRGLAALAPAAGRWREHARGAALDAARSPRYRVLVLDLIAWVVSLERVPAASPSPARETPPATARADEAADSRIGPFASRLVRKRWKRLARSLARLPQMNADERHRTRIRVKRLRYAVDFFADVLPGSRAARLDKRMRKWQTVLGRANDLAVARTMIDRLAESESPGPAQPDVVRPAEAIGVLRGWCAHAADETSRQIEKRVRR